MKNEIIDDYLNLEIIKSKLHAAQLHNFYETQEKELIISQNDEIRVLLKIEENRIKITRKYPQIGNTLQIIVTALLAVICFIFSLPFSWAIAIIGGQIISYSYHIPKIRNLENKVNKILGDNSKKTN